MGTVTVPGRPSWVRYADDAHARCRADDAAGCADLAWNRLADGRALVVLDEAHSWPEVFPRLRGAIDHDRRRNGRFLIAGRRWAFEIKLTTSPSPEDLRRLDRTADLFEADVRVLVSRTPDPLEHDGRISCGLGWLLRRLRRESTPA